MRKDHASVNKFTVNACCTKTCNLGLHHCATVFTGRPHNIAACYADALF